MTDTPDLSQQLTIADGLFSHTVEDFAGPLAEAAEFTPALLGPVLNLNYPELILQVATVH